MLVLNIGSKVRVLSKRISRKKAMSKIAIINRTNLKNYGSVLQCYALCKAVSKLGYESEIVWEKGNLSKNFDFRPIKMLSSIWTLLTHPALWKLTFSTVKEVNKIIITEETATRYNQFVKQEINQRLYSRKELIKKARTEEYHKFICGSDQIWCSTTLYVDPLMYLRFAPREKRIAYAPSIGRDFIPKYNRKKMKKFISQIPHVSIREKEGQRLIKELTGREVPIVADPTLLLEKDDWDLLKKEYKEDKKYLLCYFLDIPTENIQHKIANTAKKKGLCIIALWGKLSVCEQDGVEVFYPSAGPREFLGLVEKAECVIADSYHGMLFSMIYEKNFWSVERAYTTYDQSSRQRSLLETVGLMDRYVVNDGDIEPYDDCAIDYMRINKIIKEFKQSSLTYLKNALGFNQGE